MCLCARVFVLRVCSPSRLYTDMHLLPCLEQRQFPLPFTPSRHKPGMNTCLLNARASDPNFSTRNHLVTPQPHLGTVTWQGTRGGC